MLPSLRRHEDERATMLRSLGALHALGHPIDWSGAACPGRGGSSACRSIPGSASGAGTSRRSRGCRGSTPPAHPLLGVAQGGPRPAWEARLDLRLTPYLADHRVQHAVDHAGDGLPGAGLRRGARGVRRRRLSSCGTSSSPIPVSSRPTSPCGCRPTFDPDTATRRRFIPVPSRATANGRST